MTTLLVMVKPDGVRRWCAADEVAAIHAAWSDLLAWLHGADIDERTDADVLRHVAQVAGLRMVRMREYDIRTWQEQAHDLKACHLRLAGPLHLRKVIDEFAAHLVFDREAMFVAQPGEALIGHIYRRSPRFARHREKLMPRLLSGPIEVQLWRGVRMDLAFAVKILLRRALSDAAITNLLHMEVVSLEAVQQLRAVVDEAAKTSRPIEDRAA